MSTHACRNCGATVLHVVADLGVQPLSNAFLRPEQLGSMEPHYPLCALVCDVCRLVQLAEFESPEQIFSDYVYFSSASTSWVAHAGRYVADAVERLGLGPDSLVVELASNDGYLLRHLVDRGIPVLGVEPAANVAEVARERGVPTLTAFFGVATATALAAEKRADLMAANNVLAHVPDLHDFVEGVAILLADDGHASFEFPHLLRLLADRQWDTIYHEHFSYFSLRVVADVFEQHGLVVVDVEELPTHGGSLRVWARHKGAGDAGPRVEALLAAEAAAGLDDLATYQRFAAEVVATKLDVPATLVAMRQDGLRIAAYGAAAKGNTLMNYLGLGPEVIEFVVDANPAKQGLYTPGTHVPVLPVEELRARRPDIVFVLPWNLREEITTSVDWIRDWGGRFLLHSPDIELIP